MVYQFTVNGIYNPLYGETERDLLFASEKKEGWVNIYLDRDGEPYSIDEIFTSEKEARAARDSEIYGYVGTVKIEWEE